MPPALPEPAAPPSEFCDTLGAATFLGVSVSLLEKLRADGSGPPCYYLGRRRLVRYTFDTLRSWALTQTEQPE